MPCNDQVHESDRGQGDERDRQTQSIESIRPSSWLEFRSQRRIEATLVGRIVGGRWHAGEILTPRSSVGADPLARYGG